MSYRRLFVGGIRPSDGVVSLLSGALWILPSVAVSTSPSERDGVTPPSAWDNLNSFIRGKVSLVVGSLSSKDGSYVHRFDVYVTLREWRVDSSCRRCSHCFRVVSKSGASCLYTTGVVDE